MESSTRSLQAHSGWKCINKTNASSKVRKEENCELVWVLIILRHTSSSSDSRHLSLAPFHDYFGSASLITFCLITLKYYIWIMMKSWIGFIIMNTALHYMLFTVTCDGEIDDWYMQLWLLIIYSPFFLALIHWSLTTDYRLLFMGYFLSYS